MDQGIADDPVTLVIKAPNQKYKDQTINCFQNWTVEKLKTHLSDVYPSKPRSRDQRLVYSGKLLLDHFTLKEVLRKQEGYHMLHLVCASRTPPGSPRPHGSHSNGSPERLPAAPTIQQTFSSSPSTQSNQSLPNGESPDALRHRVGPYFNHHMHPAFMNGSTWNQYSANMPPPSSMAAYPTYSPMTAMWWQQMYARQYYLHYHAFATYCHQSRPGQSEPLSQPHQEDRRGDPEVQINAPGGGDALNEEQNQDWLDWVYMVSRAAILLSIVYFYSSFSRFVMVMGAMLLIYLHQAGWFPFNLENDFHLVEEADAQAEPQNHDAQDMERVVDGGLDDEDEDSGEEGAEDPNILPHAGFLSSTWSFIVTFFMSLIPEGPQNAAN